MLGGPFYLIAIICVVLVIRWTIKNDPANKK